MLLTLINCETRVLGLFIHFNVDRTHEHGRNFIFTQDLYIREAECASRVGPSR